MTTTAISIHALRDEASRARARGNNDEARILLTEALGQTVARDDEYALAAKELGELLEERGDPRGALTLAWFADSERRQRALFPAVPSVDRARTLFAWAEREAARKRDSEAQALYSEAADAYESENLVAHAGLARERAGDFARARALWSRLSDRLAADGTAQYPAALARFNVARMARRASDRGAARAEAVAAVHLLEEAADRFESIGQRERAFDCFQVLLTVGNEIGEFEHVLEGYVNVIRILREDHLRYYALQTYEEAVHAAEGRGELAAAATLARELAVYAKKEGLGALSNHGVELEGRLLCEAARRARERNAPQQMAENALLAAINAYAEVGQFDRVGRLYGELSSLDLEPARKAHYARAVERYRNVGPVTIEAAPLPAHLRQETAFPEVWHVDLLEWEQAGDAALAAADVMLDASTSSEAIRRRAILVRLAALELETSERDGASNMRTSSMQAVKLAETLASAELYGMLAPLERLFARGNVELRVAVAQALSRFLYKRSFITLRAALVDPEAAVVAAAARSIEELRFPHAFDPLARIHRESGSESVRASALRAIARIDTMEAAEFLVGLVEHGTAEERAVLSEALRRARGTKFVEVARHTIETLDPAPRAAVLEILAARGVSL